MRGLDHLDAARAELVAGRPQGALDALEAFVAEDGVAGLAPETRALAAERLRTLEALADSAGEGIEAARGWLRELERSLGGLEVYDRSGRQRVPTTLAGRPTRF